MILEVHDLFRFLIGLICDDHVSALVSFWPRNLVTAEAFQSLGTDPRPVTTYLASERTANNVALPARMH